jgi:hypothetical protein
MLAQMRLPVNVRRKRSSVDRQPPAVRLVQL